MGNFDRRQLLKGSALSVASAALAGCVSGQQQGAAGPAIQIAPPVAGPASPAVYAAITSEPFPVPAVDVSSFEPEFLRTRVAYASSEAPGTIVIEPKKHFLYEILGSGMANRYGIGVGREGFGWSGVAEIKSKQTWPDWYPPKEMIARRPDIQKDLTKLQSGIGMKGGPRNPLGARAMYLWQNNKDTLYRIHGTVEPETIGTNVSSGCIRMINQDVMDLYDRVPLGAKVIVLA